MFDEFDKLEQQIARGLYLLEVYLFNIRDVPYPEGMTDYEDQKREHTFKNLLLFLAISLSTLILALLIISR